MFWGRNDVYFDWPKKASGGVVDAQPYQRGPLMHASQFDLGETYLSRLTFSRMCRIWGTLGAPSSSSLDCVW